MTTDQVSASDAVAAARVLAVEPEWSGVVRASAVLGSDKFLLHAGPPFADVKSIPKPIFNSMLEAVLFEGWAPTDAMAAQLITDGGIAIRAAQDVGFVVPLAGIISPSTPCALISDARVPGNKVYAALNEGQHHATRLGRRDPGLTQHLSWMRDTLAPWLERVVQTPIALYPLLARSLLDGDDGHSRTVAGSKLVRDVLVQRATQSDLPAPQDVSVFLDESAAFALNLWMGAVALALNAAKGVKGSSIITKAGGNGLTFGIEIAGSEGWQTFDATPPLGPVDAAYAGRAACGAVGDSALVDCFGLGGQLAEPSTDVQQRLETYLPNRSWDSRLNCVETSLALGKVPVITTAGRAAQRRSSPLILLGMIDSSGEQGRIGGGGYEVPLELLAAAASRVE